MKEVLFILYVADQERSKLFYKITLQKDPVLDVAGLTEFRLTPWTRLCLIPEKNIRKFLDEKVPDPSTGNGIPRCELYMYTDEPEDCYDRAIDAGAIAISGLKLRDWGELVAYCADPDGHIIGFAQAL